jgi:hypothetical protein
MSRIGKDEKKRKEKKLGFIHCDMGQWADKIGPSGRVSLSGSTQTWTKSGRQMGRHAQVVYLGRPIGPCFWCPPVRSDHFEQRLSVWVGPLEMPLGPIGDLVARVLPLEGIVIGVCIG